MEERISNLKAIREMKEEDLAWFLVLKFCPMFSMMNSENKATVVEGLINWLREKNTFYKKGN